MYDVGNGNRDSVARQQKEPGFAAAHGSGETWRHALDACLSQLDASGASGNIGILYATDLAAEHMDDAAREISRRTGVTRWTGSVGMGICGSGAEYFDVPAFSVLIMTVPETLVRVLPSDPGDNVIVSEDCLTWAQTHFPCFGLLHLDPDTPELPQFVHSVGEALGAFLTGGLLSARSDVNPSGEIVNDTGVSGLLFSPEVPVATALTQGCTPLGEVHEVTEAEDNIIIKLNDEPALDVLFSEAGEMFAKNPERLAGYIHAALPVVGSDTGDYTVRDLIAVDPAQGWVAIGETIEKGDQIMFVRRDPNSAREDLERMLAEIKGRIETSPKAAIYTSCLARGPNMFGRLGEELSVVREHLGDVPLAGFYANGEISNNRLYTYTGVLTLFL